MAQPKILIVDDEPYNVDYLQQELEELDFKIASAGNGCEALEKVDSETPDLILLDIMMPIMDGFEALGRLKANPATRDIPIIVISANSDLQSIVKGIRLGAEDYLPKPFEPTLLHARISSSLEKKRLRDLEHLYLRSLERELEIGRQIQQSFLPEALPSIEGWEISAYFKAAREVAGDFYDAFLLPDGSLVCAVGDVCDKGVGAALFMTLFRSLIRVTATATISGTGNGTAALSPAERLQNMISYTNQYISSVHSHANIFATLFVGIWDPRDGKLSYINCGNEPPILAHKSGEITDLWPTGPVVGLLPEAQFTVKQLTMDPEDMILIFTDGVPDACNCDNASFGREPVLGMAAGNKTGTSDMLKDLVELLDSFIGAAHPFDDITLLAVKRTS